MAAPNTKNSEQSVLNQAFNETYKAIVILQGEIDGSGSSLLAPVSSQVALRLDDTTTANATYVGIAPIGTAAGTALWQIKKIDETSGMIITWADANSNFDNIWNNRASLTYS
jgi:hypothetical protein